MRLRILSDIHLELTKNGSKWIRNLVPSTPSTDILILAGDIGNPLSKLYHQFIATIAPYYQAVIIVAGNHEYYQNELNPRNNQIKRYGLTIDQIDEELRKLSAKYPNVHTLQKDELVIQNLRFLGTTLWTNPDPEFDDLINDYVYIRDFDSETRKILHHDHKTWLMEKLSEPSPYRTIVITHHLPSDQLLSASTKCDTLYYSHLEALIEQSDYWICGHSHGYLDITIGNCRCIKNAIGYPSENLGCNKFFTLEI